MDLQKSNMTIDSGKFSNVHELARAISKDDGYVSRIIRLTLLSPEIIHATIAGTLERISALSNSSRRCL